ncbi:hypothetical protein Ocin01_00776 [Orchesella cincta]|uniref:Uncharacterized protein n=1 Tax=Orchesella cincta TaxID=48709 RepID=A0A1D2NKZ2_ORCCI|nr:hypothetical protein Ocin01_00776 [Orchesella cincta]
MINVNPFCDSDARNGLQFLAGLNLIIICLSILVDTLALVEILEFSELWDLSHFYLPVYAGYALLGSDVLTNLLQLLCGWTLYSSVTRKSYEKIQKLYIPGILLFIIQLAIIICYLVCIPSSPYFYYFSLMTCLYKGYLFWPMKKFINDNSHSHHSYSRLRVSERTRLLASVA